VISEFEKRRKLGIIKCDRLYYYKSAAGREIDLIFEHGEEIYAIEIKNTLRPSSRDVSNLVEFSRGVKKKIKMYLFYTGDEHIIIKNVNVVPVASLFRRK
jgi:predicted AAA+ superfamily ATPase